jgi:hypothetical protein
MTWLRGLPAISPWAPGAAGAALQCVLADLPPAGRAGPGLPDARSYGANEEIEPHPQAREDGTEHHGPLSALAAARLSSIAPGMSSQQGPNYAGQNQEDGCQGEAEAHADRLSKLVRLEFRHLSQGRHVAGVHPSRRHVEHFWSSTCG